jgi:acyl CoA:acetate/3-ketoacid CoA transferase alpha subunit
MKDKLLPLEEAVNVCRDGSLLGLTVSTLDDAPMAFLRALLRRDRKPLRVVTMSGGGLNVDLLIGAGVIVEYETCACSLGKYGPAPNFQRALRKGTFQMKDST